MPDAVAITEVTLGEVYRLVQAQGETLGSIKESIDKRPTWEDIKRLEATRDKTEAEQNLAIKDLEDANRWVVKTVGAAIITALGGLALGVARLL